MVYSRHRCVSGCSAGGAPPVSTPIVPGATYGSSFPGGDRRDDRRDDRDRDRSDERRETRHRSRSPPREREPPRPAGPCSARCPPSCENARIYISGWLLFAVMGPRFAQVSDPCFSGLPDDATVGDVKDMFGSFGVIASVRYSKGWCRSVCGCCCCFSSVCARVVCVRRTSALVLP
jgi:hypothetical protein